MCVCVWYDIYGFIYTDKPSFATQQTVPGFRSGSVRVPFRLSWPAKSRAPSHHPQRFFHPTVTAVQHPRIWFPSAKAHYQNKHWFHLDTIASVPQWQLLPLEIPSRKWNVVKNTSVGENKHTKKGRLETPKTFQGPKSGLKIQTVNIVQPCVIILLLSRKFQPSGGPCNWRLQSPETLTFPPAAAGLLSNEAVECCWLES